MKIRKYFLLVMTLVLINFVNLSASQKRLGEKEATGSLVSSTKLNLVQKNDKKTFTIEVYRSNGKLSTKSEYELEDKDKNIEKTRLTDNHVKEKLEEYDENGKLIRVENGE